MLKEFIYERKNVLFGRYFLYCKQIKFDQFNEKFNQSLTEQSIINIENYNLIKRAHQKESRNEEKGREINRYSQEIQKYKLMVNYKHLLVVGDTHSLLGQEVINTFKDTWQIANINSKINDQCQFNLQIKFDDINKQPLTKEQLEEIDAKVKEFSKHYECILYLPQERQVIDDVKSEDIFQNYENERSNNVEPAILASYLATKYLINNGTLMFLGDYPSFSDPAQQKITYGLAQNQVNLLNLSMGDREFIEIDSFSLGLLQNEKSTEQDKNEKETKQLVKYIKQWADGIQRPISGTFIKFQEKNGFVYPELI